MDTSQTKTKLAIIVAILAAVVFGYSVQNIYNNRREPNTLIIFDQTIKVTKATSQHESTPYTASPTPASPQYNLTEPEMNMLLGRMDKRINHLSKSCDGKLKTTIWARNNLVQATPAANFLACASWKCSSTYWRHFNNALTNATGEGGSKNDVMDDEDSIRVLIVRHPFVRLISSWNEKYSREHKHAMHYYKTSRNFTHYNHDEWNKDDDQTHLMSFKDFIYWLALTSNDKNPHFAPQTKMCKPCQNFNYMIKVETMTEDAKAMFQARNFKLPPGWILNEPARSFTGGFGTSGIDKVIEHTRSMYKEIPSNILQMLKAKFANDFDHYGYTFNTKTKIPGGFD